MHKEEDREEEESEEEINPLELKKGISSRDRTLNTISIGDIVIQSNRSLDFVEKKIRNLIKDKYVRNYLSFQERKKQSYLG